MKFLTTEGWKDIELSPWAKYVAQDEDGEWYEYKREPVFGVYDPMWTLEAYPSSINYLCTGPKPKDWTQELYIVY